MTGAASTGRILVTRPRPQAEATARRLAALGHAAQIAPLSEVAHFDAPQTGLFDGVQALLLTSGNAVEALRRMDAPRDGLVLTVGARTAALARQAGFRNVTSADGDAGTLGALALRMLSPESGPVVHARGSISHHSPLTGLRDAGFETREVEVYRTRYHGRFDPDTGAALVGGEIGTILSYSPRSSQAILTALEALDLSAPCAMRVIAISAAAAAPFQRAGFARVDIAETPDEAAMFACLDQFQTK